MADLTQTLTARLTVDLSNWEANMSKAGASLQSLAKEAEKAGQSAQKGAEQGAKAQGKAADQAEKAGRKAKTAGDDSAKGSDKAKTGADKAGAAQEKLGQKSQDAGRKGKKAGEDSASGSKKSEEAAKKAAVVIEQSAEKAAAAQRLNATNQQRVATSTLAMGKTANAAAQNAGLLYDAQGQLVDQFGRTVSASKAARMGLAAQSTAAVYAAQRSQAFQQSLSEVSSTAMRTGTALTATSVLGVKAAMDWESAWTGVTKTVDGTPQQMAEVEAGLRGLAKTLPSTHQEIAAVAENAGQLGVARKDIVGFTKTMIDLGETTNLTADDAATNIAQISNVMGTMSRDGSEGVSRFGATLVALGNDGASTEAEILSMAQRMAGAVKTLGGSESDLLALSNTLASMGVRSELGGGVATRVLLKMRTAVDEGGQSLESFAQVAGVSADDFAAKFKSAPMEALDLVAKGINRVNSEGGNVTATLKSMGIKGTEETQVMLALANSGDLLTDSLKLGNQAWKENTALVDEADKRYDTAASKVKVAWNKIKDAAISAGEALAPAVGTVAEIVGGIADAFNGLPGPVKSALTSLTGFAGAALLLGGAAGKVLGFVSTTKGALSDLGISFGRAEKGPGKLAKAMGVIGKGAMGVGLAAAALSAVGHAITEESVATAEDFANAILKLSNTGDLSGIDKMLGDGAKMFGQNTLDDVNNLNDAIAKLANPPMGQGLNSWADKTFAWTGLAKSDFTQLQEKFSSFSDEMGKMVSGGNAEAAAKVFQQITDAFKAQGKEGPEAMQAALDILPGYKKALVEAANAQDKNIEGQDLLNAAMSGGAEFMSTAADGTKQLTTAQQQQAEAAQKAQAANAALEEALAAVGVSAEGAVSDMQKFLDLLFSSGMATMSARDAAVQYEQGLKTIADTQKEIASGQLGKALNKAKTDFDFTTEAGQKANAAFQGLAQNGMAKVTAMANDGVGQGKLQASLNTTYNDLVSTAKGFGIGKSAAEALAREVMGIPKDVKVKSWMEDTAKKTAEETKAAMGEVPESVDAKVNVKPGENSFLPYWAQLPDEKDASVNAVPGHDSAGPWLEGYKYPTDAPVNAVPGADDASRWLDPKADPRNAPFNATPGSNSASGFLDPLAAPRNAPFNAVQGSDFASRWLSALAQPRQMVISAVFGGATGALAAAASAAGGKATGGRLPGHAAGYRLPTAGPGTEKTDGFLGVNHKGMPLARVDAGEWIINGKSSQKYHGLLSAINADDPAVQGLAALASGGRVSWSSKDQGKSKTALAKAKAEARAAEKAEKAAQKTYDKIDGKKANKGAKSSAKSKLSAAKKRSDKADKALERAEKAYQDDRERTSRLRELEFDTRRDLYRGDIRDNYGAGNYSGVDALFEASNNKDLSPKQRATMRKLAYAQERQTKSLTLKQGMLEKRLESAQSKYDELAGVHDGVRDQVKGAMDFGSLTGKTDQWGYKQKVTDKSVLAYGKNMAAGAKKLSQKVAWLKKWGFPSAMIQQVIDEWASTQTFELADALMTMDTTEQRQLTSYFKDVERYGAATGTYLTESMYTGGVNAAQGVVKGIESQISAVEKAFAKMGTAGEKAFRKALGIKSPSRVLKAAGVWAGKGAALGVRDSIPENERAMRDLAEAQAAAYQPQYRLPASAEVQAFAASQGQPAEFDYDRLAEAMTRVQMQPAPVAIGDREVARLGQEIARVTPRLK
ncbi:phage tail tape measure protein [Galactobacter valiniphilus]|uniref:Phage tail tape measure protein n=1 Tax=Galactobacter valiniphilus TaxID=2676122 RepID=A0A399JCW3_9MICC|nr:phage tail tape measure protein [Galactobacter valiniphilus]RII41872.1 phage tail tape measure protein [Galactobacter valiniphilus]